MIGALLARRIARRTTGFFVITSRCSFEMVAKAAIFGAGALVVALRADLAGARNARGTSASPLIAVARADKASELRDRADEASGGLAA